MPAGDLFDVVAGGRQAAPTQEHADAGDRFGEGEAWYERPVTTYLGIPEYREGAGPIERGVEKFASGLASPVSLGLMIATGGLGSLAEGAGATALKALAPEAAAQVTRAAAVISKLANAGFTAQQIAGVAEAVPQVSAAIKDGDSDRALELGTQALLGAAAAGFSARHLVKSLGGGKTPAWTSDKDVIGAYQREVETRNIAAQQFERANEDLLRNRPLDVAARLYHEAGGDVRKLQAWQEQIAADAGIRPAVRQKWEGLLEIAQNLPEDVRRLSDTLREDYAHDWAELQGTGKANPKSTGRANYAGQHVYNPDDELASDVRPKRTLTKSPGFTRERTFDTLVGALHAGFEPKDAGLAAARADYVRQFGLMRGAVEAENEMLRQRADDGRPLAVTPGSVHRVDVRVPSATTEEIGTPRATRDAGEIVSRAPAARPDAMARELPAEAQPKPAAKPGGKTVNLTPIKLADGGEAWEWSDARFEQSVAGPFTSREEALANVPQGARAVDDAGRLVTPAVRPRDVNLRDVEGPFPSFGGANDLLNVRFDVPQGGKPGDFIGSADEMARLLFPDLAGKLREAELLQAGPIIGPARGKYTLRVRFSDEGAAEAAAEAMRRPVAPQLEAGTSGAKAPANGSEGTAAEAPFRIRNIRGVRIPDGAAVDAERVFTGVDGKRYLDVSDYHPAPDVFSRYRITLAPSAEAGGGKAPVFEKAPVLLHPEHAADITQAFDDHSWFRRNPITAPLLRLSTQAKKSLLSFSPFHWTTEYLRGLQMGMNPWEALKPPELTPDRVAVTQGTRYGLQLLGDTANRSLLAEGAAQHSALINRIPGVGKILTAAEEQLFGSYIPRLKALAFERLSDQLAKHNPDWNNAQVYSTAAKITNGAFGGINWRMLGASMNSVDALRMIFLAPDFTGSQLLFAKAGLEPGGSAVWWSLARVAAYNFAVARLLNLLVSGKPHVERPFSVVSPDEKKSFSVRTMPEDIWHGLTDPRGFTYNRLNPLLVRTGIEAVTGRDERGRAADAQKQVVDLLRNVTPISAQNFIPAFRRATDEGPGTSTLRALGVAVAPNKTPAERLVSELASNRAPGGTIDPARLAHHRRVLQAEDELRTGGAPDLTGFNNREIHAIRDYARMTPLESRFKLLPMADALRVWQVATKRERAALVGELLRKRQRYLRDLDADERETDPTAAQLRRMTF